MRSKTLSGGWSWRGGDDSMFQRTGWGWCSCWSQFVWQNPGNFHGFCDFAVIQSKVKEIKATMTLAENPNRTRRLQAWNYSISAAEKTPAITGGFSWGLEEIFDDFLCQSVSVALKLNKFQHDEAVSLQAGAGSCRDPGFGEGVGIGFWFWNIWNYAAEPKRKA